MSVLYKYVGEKKSKPPIEITDEVALWLMRMICGEGGMICSDEKTACLIWAIINRWFLWPGAKNYKTFIAMMRAFSQPINPRWMTGGDLARKYFGRDAASAQRLARRAYICGLKWTDVPWKIRHAVAVFADGLLPYPTTAAASEKPRISNWASLPSTPKRYPWGMNINGDWFFEEENLISGNVVAVRVE
jgi:hypothetical protein